MKRCAFIAMFILSAVFTARAQHDKKPSEGYFSPITIDYRCNRGCHLTDTNNTKKFNIPFDYQVNPYREAYYEWISDEGVTDNPEEDAMKEFNKLSQNEGAFSPSINSLPCLSETSYYSDTENIDRANNKVYIKSELYKHFFK